MTAQFLLLGWPAMVPLLALWACTLCVLLLGLSRAPRRLLAAFSLTGLVVAAVMALVVVISGQGGTIQGMLTLDGNSALFVLFFCGAGAACIIAEQGLPTSLGMQDRSGYALLLTATSGAVVVAQSGHWVPTIIGLAMVHASLAALIGAPGAWPYVLVQGFSQATTLFGAIVLYGAAGTMQSGSLGDLPQTAAQTASNSLAVLGSGLVIAGLCTALAIAPFHAWLRRACRHAWMPSGLTLSLTLPATAICALAHLRQTFTAYSDVLALLGSVSVVLGYVDALRSRSVRGSLAGITIAQSGGLLLAWVAAPDSGWVLLFCLLGSSGLALSSLWALAASVQSKEGHELVLNDLAGLGLHRPWLAAAATVSLLSIAALPPLAGSIGLLALLRSAAASYGWAAGIVLAGTLVAWLLAGKWMWTLWMHPPDYSRKWVATAPELLLLAVLPAGGLLVAGICGQALIRWIANLTAMV